MPTPAEQLAPTANKERVNEAVSACISQRQAEKGDTETQEQSVAICLSMARKATGHGSTPT